MDTAAAVAMTSTLVNIVVLAWVIIEVRGQRRESKELAALTSSLENRVVHLAAAVDQSLQQLHRALELASNVHLLMYSHLGGASTLKPHKNGGQVNTYLIELKAIAVVNGDTELIDLVGKLRRVVDVALDEAQADGWQKLQKDISAATENVQRKIYELIATTTRIPTGEPLARLAVTSKKV